MEPAEWRAILDSGDYDWAPIQDAPGATEAELQQLAAWIGRPLPEDYAAILRLGNGIEINYPNVWTVLLYSTHEIPAYARGFGILPATFSGAALIGSDGNGDALLFDIRTEHPDGAYPVYCIDFVEASLGWEAATHVADDFRGLLLLRKPLLHEVQLSRLPLITYFAQVEEPLHCPQCGAQVTGSVVFQWGVCRHYQTSSEPPTYRIAEAIRWCQRVDGEVPPWSYVSRGQHGGYLNAGDPSVGSLVTRDIFQFERDPALPPRRCLACGQPLAGAAVEIRGGLIRRAWTYTAEGPDALDNTATDYLVQPDGTLLPMTDWVDHAIALVEETDAEEAEESGGDS